MCLRVVLSSFTCLTVIQLCQWSLLTGKGRSTLLYNCGGLAFFLGPGTPLSGPSRITMSTQVSEYQRDDVAGGHFVIDHWYSLF